LESKKEGCADTREFLPSDALNLIPLSVIDPSGVNTFCIFSISSSGSGAKDFPFTKVLVAIGLKGYTCPGAFKRPHRRSLLQAAG
jgi:hypothetical protein